MAYTPGVVPRDKNELIRFLEDELQNLRFAINALEAGHLDKTHVSPGKPVTGDIRYADGTNWDPGLGAGIYFYNGTAWTRIGYVSGETWDG